MTTAGEFRVAQMLRYRKDPEALMDDVTLLRDHCTSVLDIGLRSDEMSDYDRLKFYDAIAKAMSALGGWADWPR